MTLLMSNDGPGPIMMPSAPDLEGLIEPEVLDRFKNSSVFYGDIINAQLIVELRRLTEALKAKP